MEASVSKEQAEQECKRFCTTMRLDVAPESMPTAEDKKSFDEAKRKLVTAIESGALVIDDKGQPVFTPPSGGEAITFYPPTGATLLAADGARKGHDGEKMVLMMAQTTKQKTELFKRMPTPDLRVCQSIVSLYLG